MEGVGEGLAAQRKIETQQILVKQGQSGGLGLMIEGCAPPFLSASPAQPCPISTSLVTDRVLFFCGVTGEADWSRTNWNVSHGRRPFAFLQTSANKTVAVIELSNPRQKKKKKLLPSTVLAYGGHFVSDLPQFQNILDRLTTGDEWQKGKNRKWASCVFDGGRVSPARNFLEAELLRNPLLAPDVLVLPLQRLWLTRVCGLDAQSSLAISWGGGTQLVTTQRPHFYHI